MIAVLDGVVRLGLSAAEIEAVARSAETPETAESTGAADHHEAPPRPFSKANRRDLSAVLAQQGCAATTVSATLWLAQRLGKKPCIMTTGGLGGVHRAATETFDISTDLDELARADGSVIVCSGFKSILDLAATLEALESRGVAIVGYRTNELPAFITASSGLKLEHRVETPEAAAAVIRAHRNLGLPGAVVLANPVPAAKAVDREFVETVLESALAAPGAARSRARPSRPSSWTPFATPRRAGAYGPTAPYSSPTPALLHRSPSRCPIEEPRADQKPGTPCPHTCLRAKTVTSAISMSRTRGSGMFWGKIPMTKPVEVASGAGFTRV